jgi:hypothetical protein
MKNERREVQFKSRTFTYLQCSFAFHHRERDLRSREIVAYHLFLDIFKAHFDTVCISGGSRKLNACGAGS